MHFVFKGKCEFLSQFAPNTTKKIMLIIKDILKYSESKEKCTKLK